MGRAHALAALPTAMPARVLAALALAACDRGLQETDFKASTTAAAAARSVEFRVCKFGLDMSNAQDPPQAVLCMENRGCRYEPP